MIVAHQEAALGGGVRGCYPDVPLLEGLGNMPIIPSKDASIALINVILWGIIS